jgi:hypothetical protein
LADQPKSAEAQKLAPVAPPPIATAADKLPVDQLKVPRGFKLEVYASGMVNARSLARATKERFSSVHAYSSNNKYIGRPVDMLQMPDGSMLISDDSNGAVYR